MIVRFAMFNSWLHTEKTSVVFVFSLLFLPVNAVFLPQLAQKTPPPDPSRTDFELRAVSAPTAAPFVNIARLLQARQAGDSEYTQILGPDTSSYNITLGQQYGICGLLGFSTRLSSYNLGAGAAIQDISSTLSLVFASGGPLAVAPYSDSAPWSVWNCAYNQQYSAWAVCGTNTNCIFKTFCSRTATACGTSCNSNVLYW